jgi:hypothetical protein
MTGGFITFNFKRFKRKWFHNAANVELSGRTYRRDNAKQRRFGLSSEAQRAERA